MPQFSADIRNRMGFNKYYKEDAEKAVKRYVDETASLLEDILKELGLDGDVVDNQGLTGRITIRKYDFVDIVFKSNTSDTAYGWNVNDTIFNEVYRLTQHFHKA